MTDFSSSDVKVGFYRGDPVFDTTPATNVNVGDTVYLNLDTRHTLTTDLTQYVNVITGVLLNGVFIKNTSKNPYNPSFRFTAKEDNIIRPVFELRKNVIIPTPTNRNSNTYFNIYDNERLYTVTLNSDSERGEDDDFVRPIHGFAYGSPDQELGHDFGDFLTTVYIKNKFYLTFNTNFLNKISDDFKLISIDTSNNKSMVIYKNEFNSNITYNQKIKSLMNTSCVASFLSEYIIGKTQLNKLPYAYLVEVPLQIYNEKGVDMKQRDGLTTTQRETNETLLTDQPAVSDANIKRRYFTLLG